nr:hypothetical protein [Micromonospora sp. DSM 115978]
PRSRRGRLGGSRPGPVPRRVAALLQPAPATRRRLLLVALPIAVAGASLGLTVEAFFDLNHPTR